MDLRSPKGNYKIMVNGKLILEQLFHGSIKYKLQMTYVQDNLGTFISQVQSLYNLKIFCSEQKDQKS